MEKTGKGAKRTKAGMGFCEEPRNRGGRPQLCGPGGTHTHTPPPGTGDPRCRCRSHRAGSARTAQPAPLARAEAAPPAVISAAAQFSPLFRLFCYFRVSSPHPPPPPNAVKSAGSGAAPSPRLSGCSVAPRSSLNYEAAGPGSLRLGRWIDIYLFSLSDKKTKPKPNQKTNNKQTNKNPNEKKDNKNPTKQK